MLFTIVASFLFGLKGVVGKLAFNEGVSIGQLLLLRFLLATPLLWVILYMRDRDVLSRIKVCLGKVILVSSCYAVATVADFTAISLMEVSVERMILFTYPALIVTFEALALRRFPPKMLLGCFLVTYVGLLAVLGVGSAAPIQWSGAVWALVSAFTYALYLFFSHHLVQNLGSITFTTYSNTVTTLLILACFGPTEGVLFWSSLSETSIGLIIFLTIFCTVVPFLLLFEGIKSIGSARAGIVTMISPVVAMLFANLLLGESLTILQYFGAMLAIGGIGALKLRDRFQKVGG